MPTHWQTKETKIVTNTFVFILKKIERSVPNFSVEILRNKS